MTARSSTVWFALAATVAVSIAAGCSGSDAGDQVVSTESAQRLIDESDGSAEAVRSIPDDALALVGSSEEDFTRDAEARGYIVRVYDRDGEQFSVDADFRPNRLNIGVNDGIVTEIYETG